MRGVEEPLLGVVGRDRLAPSPPGRILTELALRRGARRGCPGVLAPRASAGLGLSAPSFAEASPTGLS